MKKYAIAVVGLGLLISGVFGAMAFDPEEPDVVVARHQTYGQYLTNVRGITLYVFTKDTKGTSTCVNECLQTWPPVVFRDKSKPLAGTGADEKLLDYIKRPDGVFQITYAGMPLYLYSKDQKAGEFGGQGVGNNWYVVNPKGEIIKAAAPAAQTAQAQQPQQAVQRPQTQQAQQNQQAQQTQQTPAQTQAIAQGVKDGEPHYTKLCAGCHGDKGQGGVGSKLDGLAALKDKKGMISQVLGGGQQMPAFGSSLSDKEAAALLTYIMNSWSNKHGLVTEAEVKARR